MFDIDHFKRINDTYGHDAGDRVLKSLAQEVRTALRSIDIFARLGGEEFAVILPETLLVPALSVAERIREEIEEMAITYDKITLKITISLGVTQQEEGETVEDLLKRSDEALYEAKRNGRNRVFHS